MRGKESMKKSCWGCRHHFTTARRAEGGIYLESSCDKYNQDIGNAPEELEPGCYEALSLKRERQRLHSVKGSH
ncbi:MAG: hypothetical protein DRG71_07400 [Deltaproteobacteria bacterium]|nr:MAG: hypothetical protein DRG71_07400 [Deltaproteobacteria bacterium]